jgi:hypothetical protein
MENKPNYIELVQISKRNLKTNKIKPKSKSSTRSGNTNSDKYLWRNGTGGKRISRRKISRRRIGRRQIKSNKKRKSKRNTKRGGYVDDLNSEDFNANLAYDPKQRGGQNIGAGCPDPNFSIYNTSQLKLFPYKP